MSEAENPDYLKEQLFSTAKGEPTSVLEALKVGLPFGKYHWAMGHLTNPFGRQFESAS